MADRKEPPFFNDESLGAFHYKLPFYDTMELYIETLTGTCFELRVLPFEAIVSVKAKIQRLEGIPVAQQHLIWNNVELDDEHCLHDYGIAEGCTLKLVLAMRGGPINTRKVTVEEPTKDVSELMEGSKEEVWEKSASNKQVTFVVYRDGDQLNFFRVVDRGDGTLTPLSESVSGGSVYNVYTEEEEDGESSAAQHSRESSITMNKMRQLKAKMEDMNLNKKPKKSAKVKPRPPASPHPGSTSVTPSSSRHHHRLFRSLSHITQARASTSQLPPIRDNDTDAPCPTSTAAPPSHLSIPRRPPPPTFASPSCYMLQEEPWDTCPPLAKIRPPPKVSRLEMGGRLMRDCVYPQLPPLCTRGPPEAILDPGEPSGEALGLGLLDETPTLVAQTQAPFAELTDPLSLDVSSQADGGIQMPISPSPLSTWTLAERTSFHISPPSPIPSSPKSTSSGFETLVKPVSPHPPPRLRAVKVESPGKRPELISKREARGITRLANQGCKEPVGSLSKSELMATLSTRTSEGISSSRGGENFRESLGLALALPPATASGHGTASKLPSITNTRIYQDGAHRGISAHMATNSHTSATGAMPSLGRIGSSSQPLPPVRASASTKKKSSSKHCFLCGKKTGLATSYECRCGQNFCATHRYAETHECTYDYKSAGRRFLQDTNPLISAPKLPKI